MGTQTGIIFIYFRFSDYLTFSSKPWSTSSSKAQPIHVKGLLLGFAGEGKTGQGKSHLSHSY